MYINRVTENNFSSLLDNNHDILSFTHRVDEPWFTFRDDRSVDLSNLVTLPWYNIFGSADLNSMINEFCRQVNDLLSSSVVKWTAGIDE